MKERRSRSHGAYSPTRLRLSYWRSCNLQLQKAAAAAAAAAGPAPQPAATQDANGMPELSATAFKVLPRPSPSCRLVVITPPDVGPCLQIAGLWPCTTAWLRGREHDLPCDGGAWWVAAACCLWRRGQCASAAHRRTLCRAARTRSTASSSVWSSSLWWAGSFPPQSLTPVCRSVLIAGCTALILQFQAWWATAVPRLGCATCLFCCKK